MHSNNDLKFEKHLDVLNSPDSARAEKIVDLLVSATPLSKPLIKQAMTKGAVWISSEQGTRRVRRADKTATAGERIHLYYDEKVLAQQPEPARLIADEDSYSIWFKPYGVLCQGSKWGDQCTINRWVEMHMQPQRPAFIVHRLDRAATGLIAIAHKKKTAAYFSRLFQDRNIDKQYQAIVLGHFPEQLRFESEIDGKVAITEARRRQYDEKTDRSLLDINIETGRKHQIRRHLSGAGYPIFGDRLYGKDLDDDGAADGSESGADSQVNLCLASCYLAFDCPRDQLRKEYRLPEALMLKLN